MTNKSMEIDKENHVGSYKYISELGGVKAAVFTVSNYTEMVL